MNIFKIGTQKKKEKNEHFWKLPNTDLVLSTTDLILPTDQHWLKIDKKGKNEKSQLF